MNFLTWQNHARRLSQRRAVRHTFKAAAVLLVAVAGAWLGVALGGHVRTPLGPAEIGMSLHPAGGGETVVDVHPLGNLLFDTHDAPLRVRITLESISEQKIQSMIEDPRLADRLPEIIQHDLREGIVSLAVRSLLCAGGGALLAGLVVFRRPKAALYGTLAALVALGGTGALAAATFRPSSVVEPRYTGLLAGAPSLVGSAQSIVTRFESYQAQLTKLVSNVTKLYDTVSVLPVYEGDPTSIRVLSVADIHLNPIAWNLIRSVAEQFKVDLIVDAGDITDHGTRAEDRFVEEISRLDVPYVFVRGNHDSRATERAVAKQKNAVVLDDKVQEVAGLKIYGLGDPRFTPDKTAADAFDQDRLFEFGREHAVRMPPADLVVVHDSTVGRAFSGKVPMILAGHAHARATEILSTGTRLFVQGSTGGAGLRALEHEEPTPVTASVLYFDKGTLRLQAWDDITMGGLGEQSVQIQRHIEPEPTRTIGPEPVSAPLPTGSIDGTATPIAGSPLWHEGQTSPMLQRSPTEGVTDQDHGPEPPSSSGLGHRPFKAAARVRIPLGAPAS
jgi:predicted MPP superfamily phosphohydrolase